MLKVSSSWRVADFPRINCLAGIVKQLGETAMAMSTLVSGQTFILDQSLKENLTFHKVIAVYTFVGIWLGTPVESMRATKGILMAVWLYIAFMVILGNITNRGKGKSHFQLPTPVSLSDRGEYKGLLLKYIIVLVLDRGRLSPVAHLGRIYLVLDHTGVLFCHIRPTLPLGTWQPPIRWTHLVEAYLPKGGFEWSSWA